MRLTLIISSLNSGGAERVLSIMANYWASQGWLITLLTFDDASHPPFYDLDQQITHIPLDLAKNSSNILIGTWNNIARVLELRTAIKQSSPDAVISFMDRVNIITLIATRGLGLPVVISERVYPSACSLGKQWEQLRQWSYPFSTCIVVQSQKVKNCFASDLQKQITIIPNPVLFSPIVSEEQFEFPKKKQIIAVGRLSKQKGFDILLQAFALLKNTHPEWSVLILGAGILLSELEDLSDQLGLSERVIFGGRVANIYEYLAQSHLFVLSSRFEGFPNALCEAMASGLAVISTDCPSGPREIIRDGIDGILVPNEDVDALAQAMSRLMSDEDERKRLGQAALAVTERFGLEQVMAMWEDLLNCALNR